MSVGKLKGELGKFSVVAGYVHGDTKMALFAGETLIVLAKPGEAVRCPEGASGTPDLATEVLGASDPR